jgi:hypothetical protein
MTNVQTPLLYCSAACCQSLRTLKWKCTELVTRSSFAKAYSLQQTVLGMTVPSFGTCLLPRNSPPGTGTARLRPRIRGSKASQLIRSRVKEAYNTTCRLSTPESLHGGYPRRRLRVWLVCGTAGAAGVKLILGLHAGLSCGRSSRPPAHGQRKGA